MCFELCHQAVGTDLEALQAKTPEAPYRLWIKKNWNLHRGVLALREKEPVSSAKELESRVRRITAFEYNLKRTWLRGFAFGVLVRAPAVPPGAEALEKAIDRYNRLDGVWQWLVYWPEQPKLAFGIHTWIEGYLSPTFRRLVQAIEASGVRCPCFVREKGTFFAFAQKLSRTRLEDFQKDAEDPS